MMAVRPTPSSEWTNSLRPVRKDLRLKETSKENIPEPEVVVEKPPTLAGLHPTKITNPSVALIFNPSRDEKLGKPYWKCGDKSMYTKENLARRRALKSHPAVAEAIQRFANLYHFDQRGGKSFIKRDEYLRVHMLVAKALIPKLSSKEALKVALEDWENDAKGEKTILPYDEFHDSIFELVDLWTTSTDIDEYISFLDALNFRVRYTGQKDPSAYDILKT
eukprot:Rmarinus@m.285